ncbi:MAG: TIGR03084 family metal-binding protein [Actinomycetota bacterium]|nr:TIGR03084 family metal-binding protein [Actinomycetota bacterium]
MTSVLEGILDDLKAEGDRLWTAVAALGQSAGGGWDRPTPAPGWSVATQIAHLAWTDEQATAAAHSLTPEGEEAWDAIVLAAIDDPQGFVDHGAEEVSRLAPAALLARWGLGRERLAVALREFPDGQRMPWFGPPMSPASMATARFMETWAHALDVYAALGIEPDVTDRIRHVAHIGVRTRDYSYTVHEQQPPAEAFRVELTAPSGETWTWGPEDAAQKVTGSAHDFCLLVTQRIHRDDTALVATGPDAQHWLTIAQCFAGPPGEGRAKA